MKAEPRLVEKLFRAKEKRRRELARLPFAEKMKIVVDLQRVAREIRQVRPAAGPSR